MKSASVGQQVRGRGLRANNAAGPRTWHSRSAPGVVRAPPRLPRSRPACSGLAAESGLPRGDAAAGGRARSPACKDCPSGGGCRPGCGRHARGAAAGPAALPWPGPGGAARARPEWPRGAPGGSSGAPILEDPGAARDQRDARGPGLDPDSLSRRGLRGRVPQGPSCGLPGVARVKTGLGTQRPALARRASRSEGRGRRCPGRRRPAPAPPSCASAALRAAPRPPAAGR